MNNRIKMIAAVCIMVFGCMGCTPKDSGLYQINTLDDEAEQITNNDVEDNLTKVEDYPIYVHVCGAVNNPGVYEFRIGNRVFDAIEAAGGFSEDASEDYVNLAMELSDAMKIVIPTKEAAETSSYGIVSDSAKTVETSGAGAGTDSDGTGSGSKDGRININTADAATLMTISGIGETRAAAIIAYRDVHGEFENIQDITRVSGIGDSTFEKIKNKITTDR